MVAPFVGRNFIVSSLTKPSASGLQQGRACEGLELARRIWLLNDLFAATGAHPAERMSVMAFDHLAQFRERARALLNTNRALLNAFLDSRADLECFRPPAGTVVFPRLLNGDSEAFVQLLREKYETSVVPGAERRDISGRHRRRDRKSEGRPRGWGRRWTTWPGGRLTNGD
jgi:aspartate/methionine/tyrosine aminotransferase